MQTFTLLPGQSAVFAKPTTLTLSGVGNFNGAPTAEFVVDSDAEVTLEQAVASDSHDIRSVE